MKGEKNTVYHFLPLLSDYLNITFVAMCELHHKLVFGIVV